MLVFDASGLFIKFTDFMSGEKKFQSYNFGNVI